MSQRIIASIGLSVCLTGQATAQTGPGLSLTTPDRPTSGIPRTAASPAGDPEALAGLDLRVPDALAAKAGRKVWINETGGRAEAITAWNVGEAFPSLGIGHFIWYPAGRRDRYAESFPAMLAFLRKRGTKLPDWLDHDPIPPAPWPTRQHFNRAFYEPRMRALRHFLHSTFGPQTQFLIQRMRQALPKILATLPPGEQRAHVRAQFARVVKSSNSLYPLLDYVSFKGEGIAPSETFPDAKTGLPVGWGLKQVLSTMRGTVIGQAALDDFSAAAKATLRRRIANHAPSRRWERGWMARCDSYRRPLG